MAKIEFSGHTVSTTACAVACVISRTDMSCVFYLSQSPHCYRLNTVNNKHKKNFGCHCTALKISNSHYDVI